MFDEIGYWTEVKLEIIKRYAVEYSRILTSQSKKWGFHHIYIDGFAGGGFNISRKTGEKVPGSPMIALETVPPFKEYHFVERDPKNFEVLRNEVKGRGNVFVYPGDCNDVLPREIYPKILSNTNIRALCLLDPYGLHCDWSLIETAGRTGHIDVFFNFNIMDANRNVFWRNPALLDDEQIERMNKVWGDGSWRQIVYKQVPTLFGDHEEKVATAEDVAEAFRQRLLSKARFKFVPEPVLMRNIKNGPIYYLFFAAPKAVAKKIVEHLFKEFGPQSRHE
jgi:three-Cys-motif partner protein